MVWGHQRRSPVDQSVLEEAAVFKGLVPVSGTRGKHGTAHPRPWLCQPRRKEADVFTFVHFISIFERSGSAHFFQSGTVLLHISFPQEHGYGHLSGSNLSRLKGEPGQGEGRRLLHPEVFEKRGTCQFWRAGTCPSVLPVAVLPAAPALPKAC